MIAAVPGLGPAPAVERPRDLAPLIDHTVLKLDATRGDVVRACEEALQHGFAGVCVREAFLAEVVERLGGRGPRAVVVCDFPLGAAPAARRAEEARRLAGMGAQEIDVVFPLPALAARDHGAALADLAAVVAAARPAAVKVILETGALAPAEKAAACALALAAGAAFVKTSTGFGRGGATEEDVALLRALAGSRAGVKASGGVRTAADALRLVRAGASRIGTSNGVALLAE